MNKNNLNGTNTNYDDIDIDYDDIFNIDDKNILDKPIDTSFSDENSKIFDELNQNNIDILTSSSKDEVNDDFLDITSFTDDDLNQSKTENDERLNDKDFSNNEIISLYKLTDEIQSKIEENDLEEESENKNLVSELNKDIPLIDDDLDILSQREHKIMKELEEKEKLNNNSFNNIHEVNNIQEKANQLIEEYSSIDEELLKNLTQEELEELIRLSPEIKQRDKSKRIYLNRDNGEIIYEKNNSINISKKEEIIQNIKLIKNKSKEESQNIKKTFNETIDNPQKRTRLLYLTLFIFFILFIGMFFVIFNQIEDTPNKQINSNINPTIKEENTTNNNTIDEVLVENLTNKDLNRLNEDYLNKLKELNRQDLKNTIIYIDNKMNRVSYSNRLKNNLVSKKNHLVTIENNVKSFKSKEEKIIYEKLQNKISLSIDFTTKLINLLDEGLTKDKLDNLTNEYYIHNIF